MLDRPDQAERARKAAESVADLSWDRSGDQFVQIVTEAMRG